MRHPAWIALALAALVISPAFADLPTTAQDLVNLEATAEPIGPGPGPGPGPQCHLLTIAKGHHSGIGHDNPQFTGADLIIRNPDAWLAFWQAHTELMDPPPPPPPVDFRHQVVIATIQGPQPSGGPNTAILGLEQLGPLVHIRIFDDERPGAPGVITNAFHIVAVNRRCLPQPASLTFVHVAPLPDTGVVLGHVFGERPDGPPVPLPEAHVALIPADPSQEPRHAVTGGDGTYFFVNVPPGPYDVVANAPGFQPAVEPIDVQPNARIPVQFILQPIVPDPGAIVGHTLQPSSGGPVPLPDTHVVLIRDGQPVADTFSNNEGFYAFPEIPPGPYLIRAMREGFLPQQAAIIVEPGQTVEHNFLLEPGIPPELGTFAGLVMGITPNGSAIPLEDARVHLLGPNGYFNVVFTNNAGEFGMPDVPVGQYLASADKPGWQPEFTMVEILPNQVTEYVFHLIPALSAAPVP